MDSKPGGVSSQFSGVTFHRPYGAIQRWYYHLTSNMLSNRLRRSQSKKTVSMSTPRDRLMAALGGGIVGKVLVIAVLGAVMGMGRAEAPIAEAPVEMTGEPVNLPLVLVSLTAPEDLAWQPVAAPPATVKARAIRRAKAKRPARRRAMDPVIVGEIVHKP